MSRASTNNMTSSGDAELRRGPWTLQEDTLLVHYIASSGEGNWNLLAKNSGLKRTGKSCRLRWLNYLKPDVKRGNLSPQEQILILQLHSRWGNRWSKIAKELPGRTDNEIKNFWRTRIHKQARHLNMDTNSSEFRDMIRCFWIPRLLQKIHGPVLSQNSLDHDPESAPQQVQHMNQHEYQVYSDQSSSSGVTCSDSMNMFQVSDFSAMEPPCNNNIEYCENPIESSGNWVCDDFSNDGPWGLDELWH